MPGPLEDDGELEGALGEPAEEDADDPEEPAEEDADDPEEPLDGGVAERWLCPEYDAAATPEKTPVAASPPTRV